MGMMKDFPNLYTDISYAIHNDKIHQPIFQDLANPQLQDRIMYGTDFFLTEREMPEKSDYATFKQKAVRVQLSNGKTAWEQIASVNTQRFLQSKYCS